MMANVIHGTARNPFAAPKLFVERENKGQYSYTYNGRQVIVQYLDAHEPSKGWVTVVNGDYDKDFNTKREAVAEAKRYLGC